MSKTNYDIAHEFAYGATDGHTGNWNLYINGDCIYSYGRHFCIAKRVGLGTILFTTRGYSNSTAKHKNYVARACSHMNLVYCYDPCGTHNDNQEAFLREIREILPNLAKARKPEKYLHAIYNICARAMKYCEFFGIPMNKDLAKFVNSEDFNKTNEEYIAELKKRAEKERRAQMKKKREQLDKWHNFESNYPPYGLEFQELRVNAENKNRIETTMGVEIPFELGREFFERIKNNLLKVGDQLLYYSVREITDKVIKIGCHTFKRKYLLDFGARVF